MPFRDRGVAQPVKLYNTIMDFEVDSYLQRCLSDKAKLLWYKLLFWVMMEESNVIKATTENIRTWTGWSAQTIAAARQELIAADILEYEKGTRGHPGIYRLLNVPAEGVGAPLWATSTT